MLTGQGALVRDRGLDPTMDLGFVGQVELPEDPADVGLHGASGHPQPGCDGSVGEAVGKEGEDLPLAIGQAVHVEDHVGAISRR